MDCGGYSGTKAKPTSQQTRRNRHTYAQPRPAVHESAARPGREDLRFVSGNRFSDAEKLPEIGCPFRGRASVLQCCCRRLVNKCPSFSCFVFKYSSVCFVGATS